MKTIRVRGISRRQFKAELRKIGCGNIKINSYKGGLIASFTSPNPYTGYGAWPEYAHTHWRKLMVYNAALSALRQKYGFKQ